MDRDVVARAVDLLHVLAVAHRVVQIPGRVDREVRIVPVDFHPEPDRGVRDLLADRAQTDDAQLLALDFRARERLLRLLGGLADGRIRRVRLDPLDAADDVAAGEKQRGDRQFLHAVRVRPGRVEHDNTLLRVGRVRNVVHARTGARHGEQVLAGHELVHLRAAHKRRVRFLEFLRPDVPVVQVLEPAVRNRIQACVLIVHFFVSSVEFIMEYLPSRMTTRLLYHILRTFSSVLFRHVENEKRTLP